MKKILIMQPFLSYGGAEAVSVQLAYQLKKRGYATKLMALFKKKNLPLLADKIDIVSVLNLHEFLKADVLNSHNFPTLWIAIILGKILKTPVVWTVHNLPQSPFGTGIDKLFAGECKEIISVSEKVQRQILKNYNLSSKVIYPGINYRFWSQGKSRKGKNLSLLIAGRLVKEKNYDIAIKAFAKVSKQVKKARLLIAGDGPYKENLKLLAKNLGISERVSFLGFQTPEKLRNLYSSADMLISPSYKTEGFNLTPFEALAAGTISLVARGSGADEVIKREGIGFVANPTCQDFSKKILEIYKKDDKSMVKKGRAFVKNKLSWERYADKFLNLI